MRTPRALTASTALLLALAGCGSSGETVTVEPSILPTAAEVTVVDSALVASADTAFSPSGRARVAPVDGQWCLEDASGLRCVDALAEGSAAHGIVWRPDETAIAVTWGSQDPISFIDFEAGTTVETDLDRHRILAWSPDGSDLLGLDIERVGELLRIDPVTLEGSRFTSLARTDVPQILWPTGDRLWAASPSLPEVYTLSSGGDSASIDATLASQRLLSSTADGELVLGLDEDVTRGVEGPPNSALTIFERDGERAIPVVLPPSIEQGRINDAQLAADGRALLVLHSTDDGDALSSAAIDPETREASSWTTITTWSGADPLAPRGYASNGVLRWTGGSQAWILTGSDELIELDLQS